MSYNYVVTAQKPTAVTHVATGNFTGPDHQNLILAKSTRVEIHHMTPEGLKPVLDIGIYGRIAVLELYRPPTSPTDYLFISTERYRFCVLAFDQATGEIVTKAGGDVSDKTGRPSDNGQIGIVDPEGRMIGMRLYDGLFKVIPIVNGQFKDAFNIRLEELQVIDIKFLYGTAKPTIVVLYEDSKNMVHVKTYEVLLREKEFGDGPWEQRNVEGGATMLIPVPKPMGGVLIIGEQTVTYHNGDRFKSIAMRTTFMRCFGRVDPNGSRFLLGDMAGNLHMLLLVGDGERVADLRMEWLGETTSASCLAYLDNGVVFVGSVFGDSQLIRLVQEKDENGSFIEVIESYSNLGPIVDLCVVDLDRQGQGQVVTCSGVGKDGSLRVIRNGIGINEQATVELPGIKGVWALRRDPASNSDSLLVVSFVGETRFLSMAGFELEETEIAGFDATRQTLFCGNVLGGQFVQITEAGVRLVSAESLAVLAQWAPPAGTKVNVASCNGRQILLATGGGHVVHIEIGQGALGETGHAQMEHEVACVDISPLDDSGLAHVCAVGLWTDISVRVLRAPTLEPLAREVIGGDIIPRSVLLASFEGVAYLLCALGDGSLVSFVLDPATCRMSERKKVLLGTQPLVLTSFYARNSRHVFACSDRPSVIYSSNRKLLFSNVNLREVAYVCPFNSESFPDSLALATDGSLTIGTIDEIQKLHIRAVPLGETPRRIAHQESTRTFAVATMRSAVDADGREYNVCFVRLIDDQTFETLHTFQLDEREEPGALLSTTFAGDPTPYYVVGTALVLPTDDEPKKGRLIVLRVAEGRLVKVAEKEIRGACYSLNAFNGKLLASINSKVAVFRWADLEDGTKELQSECGHSGHILAIIVKTRGEFIAVGDLMNSISLCVYKPLGGTIEEIARDSSANWMLSLEILDDDHFLGAENSGNLFTCRHNSDAATDEDRARLEVVGEYHLGEYVNVFRHGSLVMRLPEESENPIQPSLIFGTINGVLGVVASLTADQYAFLHRVQHNLTRVIRGVGGFSHDFWRAFSNERKTSEARNFIDGDLIESFLDLSREKMAVVCEGLKIARNGTEQDVSVDMLIKIVEELTRIH